MADSGSASEITVSTAKVGSSLAAALADIDRFTEQHMPPWSVIVAAARERLRLSRIPCETCGGLGWFWTDAEHSEEGKNPCPICGGSGEVYGDELIEAVAKTLAESDDETWFPYRGVARAVLDALDLWMKEAK